MIFYYFYVKIIKKMRLLIKKLSEDARVPSSGSPFAAGLDLYSLEDVIIRPNSKEIIGTGIAIEWVDDENVEEDCYYLRIAPRSGLAAKNSIDVLAGVIDCDYRGEIKVILINHSTEYFKVNKGDRIAQAILERIERFSSIEVVEELSTTIRNSGGFGSTGIK